MEEAGNGRRIVNYFEESVVAARAVDGDGRRAVNFVEIDNRFSHHTPDEEGVAKMEAIREKVRELAYLIEHVCPNTREKATALTQLSFVMMSANSAIVQSFPIANSK